MSKYANINVRMDDPNLSELTRKGANIIIKWLEEEIIVRKIPRNTRSENQKTKNELRKLGLTPTDPPVGYTFHPMSSDILYLYDIEKTKTFEISEEEKAQLKEYRKNLRIRKTCPVCGKVQKCLDDLEHRYIISERYYSCLKCYEAKEEEINQERRKVKNDYTSFFIKKGISLNVNIGEHEIIDIVYLDFETTGLSPDYDEILQVAIIDNNDRVLFYKLCKPKEIKIWDEAMNIHGITPTDVENEFPFEKYIDAISNILSRASTIVCYNCPFELSFLDKYKVNYSHNNYSSKFKDCMIMFATIYGEWNDYFGNYKWQKLTTAANYYGYDFEGNAHNSLSDTFATKFIYEKIIEKEIKNDIKNSL